jgi:hypothetical protein
MDEQARRDEEVIAHYRKWRTEPHPVPSERIELYAQIDGYTQVAESLLRGLDKVTEENDYLANVYAESSGEICIAAEIARLLDDSPQDSDILPTLVYEDIEKVQALIAERKQLRLACARAINAINAACTTNTTDDFRVAVLQADLKSAALNCHNALGNLWVPPIQESKNRFTLKMEPLGDQKVIHSDENFLLDDVWKVGQPKQRTFVMKILFDRETGKIWSATTSPKDAE